MIKNISVVFGAVVLAVITLNASATSVSTVSDGLFAGLQGNQHASFDKVSLKRKGRKPFSVSELDGTFEVVGDRNTAIGKALFV